MQNPAWHREGGREKTEKNSEGIGEVTVNVGTVSAKKEEIEMFSGNAWGEKKRKVNQGKPLFFILLLKT